ncbi:MAG: carboxypeptidase-like regulatory domain-containing protein, partial [bacterium]
QSDEFPIIIESSKAPVMKYPISNYIKTLSPVFRWEQVQEQMQGVPYYLLIMTDQEIVILEDEETGDYSIEGANPIWAVLVPAALTEDGILAFENAIPYGTTDPSGTFSFDPPALLAGGDYWWIVLNCYGPHPEMASTVQSGVGHFRIDLPPSDLNPPELVSPAPGATLSGETILFRWNAVPNAVAYQFKPYKIEIEEGVEVVRPIWQTKITTTNTVFEYDAAHLLVKGNYKWGVAAISEQGLEIPSGRRAFQYEAPSTTLHIQTWDSRGTPTENDDPILPRVTVSYDAIVGVDMGLPLSTDKQGERLNLTFAPGTYVFSAMKEGFAPFKDTLDLTEGQIVTAHFRLSPELSILTGRVQDDRGSPVSAAKITVRHTLHPSIVRSGTSSQSGSFGMTVIPGPWSVSASKSGYRTSAEVSISVKSGEEKAIASPFILNKNKNRVTGSIVNRNGQAIVGASVEVFRTGDRQAILTDADGRYSFFVDNGSWSIRASKNGFAPASRSVSVSSGQTLEVTPPLELLPASSLVIGTVSDGLKAIANAAVAAVPVSGSAVTTVSDGYGKFTLSLNPGYYTLRAEKVGYSSKDAVTLSLNAGETASGVILYLKTNSGKISGSVTTDGIVPLAGTRIDLDGKNTLTDDGGRFSVEVIPGTFRVAASKTGFISSDPIQVTVAPGQSVNGVNFVLIPNASVIYGRVVFGGGVAGAVVRAHNGMVSETLSDENGYYVLNVDAGTYALFAVKSGFISDTLNLVVGQAQVLEGNNIALTENIATLRGAVTEASNGVPLMGVRVEVPSTGISTNSKPDGSYTLRVIPSGIGYSVRASKEGYMTSMLPTGTLTAGSSVTIDFSLSVFSTRLSGTIVDELVQPVDLATVFAVANMDTIETTSQSDGSYRLNLPSAGGTFTISVKKTGYVHPEGPVSIYFPGGEKTTRNFTLQRYFALLRGRIFSIVNDAFIADAKLTLTEGSKTVGSTRSNDDAGRYDFLDTAGDPFLSEGTYNFLVQKSGYSDTLVVGLHVSGGTTTTLDIGLRPFTGVIAGIVTDGSVSVSGATIVADHQGSDRRYSQVTDADGLFRFDPIPTGSYRLRVNRSGYTFGDDTTVTTPKSDLYLVVSINKGRFYGAITDSETDQGIGSATVIAKDGQGNEVRVYSRSDGSYDTEDVRLMPSTYSYSLTISRGGYNSVSRESVSSTKGDTTSFQLQRIWGSIAGKVKLPDALGGAPIVGVVVRVRAGNVSYSDTTDTQGNYTILKLPTDYYYVSVEKAGYISNAVWVGAPHVSLYSGGQRIGIDFVLEKVALTTLSITGPLTVLNLGTAAYSYAGKTADGRQVPIIPAWSVDHWEAVDSVSLGGVLYTKKDFIGPLWIILTDAHSGASDSLRVHVVASVSPTSGETVLQDYQGALFHLPAHSVNTPISFGLQYPDIPDMKRLMTKYRVAGRVYAFQPAYYSFLDQMTLTLPVPESVSTATAAGQWDRSRLTWEIVEGSEVNGGIRVETDLLAQWAVMASSQPLGIRNFEAKPNPFSPYLRELKISFVPTSQSSTNLFVSLKIYNMVGDLVRTLVEDKAMAKDTPVEDLIWNGKTDSGSMALNGRYLIHIEVRDGSGVERLLKSIVMIK